MSLGLKYFKKPCYILLLTLFLESIWRCNVLNFPSLGCVGSNFLRGNKVIRSVQNKPNGRCYEDVFNQMYILILVLSNTTINISTNTNFEQIMVDFSINWLCKLFHQANFGLSFEEIEIDFEQLLWLANWHQKTDKGHWTVEGSTMWYSSKDNKIKLKILSKILPNSTRPREV